jgi:hypothetical protein
MTTTTTTNEELAHYAEAFAYGKVNLLVILGNPGMGKKTAIRRAIADRAQWPEGKV